MKIPLGWFLPKDRIHKKFSPNYLQQEIWLKEYHIWEANKNEFLSKALVRNCPLCSSTDRDFLWDSEDGYNYVRCRDCEFVYVTPCFTYDQWREYFRRFEKDTKQINNILIESRFEDAYLQEDFKRFSFYLELLKKYKSTGRILDIGCLSGSFLKLARDYGYTPYGIEYRLLAIEAARKKFDLQITEGFFEELAPNIILNNQRFEIITLWETLEHVLFPDNVIKNANQLLSKNGLIGITVPNYDNLQVKILRERCFHCLGGPGNAGHINMFTPTTLRTILEQNNFEVLLIETEGSSSYHDVFAYLSDRFELINSYSNAFAPPKKKNPTHPYFFSPVTMNTLLAFAPLFKIIENAMMKGAVILAIAKKKG